MVNQDKVSLRKQLRQLRRSLSQQAQQQAAQSLCEQLISLEAMGSAKKIAIYLANDGEIDTTPFIKWCWQNDKDVFMPIVRQIDGANTLLFAPYNEDTRLTYNHYKIAEPDVPFDSYILADQLDLVLMPLVGFDGFGNRIGMGGGFYDRTFEFKKDDNSAAPMLIGLAHECQKVAKINSESWDIPLSSVQTDKMNYAAS